MLTVKAPQRGTSFQVYTVFKAQIVVLRSVMCSLVDIHGRFRGTQCERAVNLYFAMSIGTCSALAPLRLL